MTEPFPFSDDEIFAMCHATSARAHPGDDEALEILARKAGPEVVERARNRATEIVASAAADGSLERLACALERSSYLSGTDVANLLRSPEPGSTPASVVPHPERNTQ
jgi:hypothetical protein